MAGLMSEHVYKITEIVGTSHGGSGCRDWDSQ